MTPTSKAATLSDALDRWLQPTHSALLVVDLQRWYVDPAACPFDATDDDWPGGIPAGIGRLVAAARAGSVPVVWTRTVEGAPESPAVLAARWERAPTEPRLLQGSDGWSWTATRPAVGELVVDKVWPDACTSTALTDWLRGRPDLEAVVLVGAYAARCVLATAQGLAHLGYVVLVPDGLVLAHPGCPEEAEVAQHVIATTIGYVVDADDLACAWAQPPAFETRRW